MPSYCQGARWVLATINFGFLQGHDQRLATLGAQAERYFRDDPSTAIVKLRQFAELLAKLIAAHHALYLGERETFEETLRRLSYERIIPKEAADVFHALRKVGNVAVHEARGSHSRGADGSEIRAPAWGLVSSNLWAAAEFQSRPLRAAARARRCDRTLSKRKSRALQRMVAESADAAAAARCNAEEQAAPARALKQRLPARGRGTGDVGTAGAGQ